MKIIKKSIPSNFIRALIEDSSTANNDTRTVELTFSTGYKGLRTGWDGPYYEELSMNPQHVDMTRLQNGAPLLASHDSESLNSVIGVVERAWLEGNSGKAIVRFSKDPEADKVYQKVKEKILRNVSVGYKVLKYEDVTQKGDKIPTYRGVNWSPMEVSIVGIGFDPHAQVRKNEQLNEVEIETQEQEKIMDKVEQEEQRQLDIRRAVRLANFNESFADELIAQNLTFDQARKMVLEKLVSQQPKPIDNSIRVDLGEDNHSMRHQILQDALLHRMDSKNFKITENSRHLFGQSLIQQIQSVIPRQMMESDGVYAKRVMSTSDLPLVLANVAEKSLQMQYELAPKSYTLWCKQDTVRNYKEHSFVNLSNFPELLERAEGGEVTFGSIGEKNETIQLADFARAIAFTSQMLVNDDLSGLQRMVSGAGIAAARLENKLAYAALTTNKTMKEDNTALYHANHGNLGTPGAISETTIEEAYKGIITQKSIGGLDPLNLLPKYLIVGPNKKVEATKALAAIQATQTSNVNPFSGSMELIVDAQITGNQYYFACDPTIMDTVTLFRLEGQTSPMVQTKVDFMTNSLFLKVDYACAATALDYRGLFKNAGN